MKILKVFLVILFVLIFLVVLIIGYFGFMPGVSSLMGTNKPRDLGMSYSEEKYLSGLEKSGVEVNSLPTESIKTIDYQGSHAVVGLFTADELTSNSYRKEEWTDFPIHDVQVRINPDNTCEVSGVLELDTMGNFLTAMDIDQFHYKEALEKAKIPLGDIAFYAKGSGTASNNQLNINVSKVEFGRFNVPGDLINKYQGEMVDFAENLMTKITGFSVNEARFENGAIYFDGTVPDVEFRR